MKSPLRGILLAVVLVSMLGALPTLSLAGDGNGSGSNVSTRAGHCDVDAANASQGGTWTCIDAYAQNGVSHQYGEQGFNPKGEPPPAPGAPSSGTSGGGTTTQSLHTRRSVTPVRVLTMRFQSDSDWYEDYGIGSTYIGRIHWYTHINLQGWKNTTTMSFLVNSGPRVDPALYWSNTCGQNSSTPGAWSTGWSGQAQSATCAINGVYGNSYKWTWYAEGYSPLWSDGPEYSEQWTCNSLYTQKCYFGSP